MSIFFLILSNIIKMVIVLNILTLFNILNGLQPVFMVLRNYPVRTILPNHTKFRVSKWKVTSYKCMLQRHILKNSIKNL